MGQVVYALRCLRKRSGLDSRHPRHSEVQFDLGQKRVPQTRQMGSNPMHLTKFLMLCDYKFSVLCVCKFMVLSSKGRIGPFQGPDAVSRSASTTILGL